MSWGNGIMREFAEDTGAEKTTGISSVELQPISQAYPAGKIALAQCTNNLARWILAADSLSDDMHYKWYVNGTYINEIKLSPNSIPNIG